MSKTSVKLRNQQRDHSRLVSDLSNMRSSHFKLILEQKYRIKELESELASQNKINNALYENDCGLTKVVEIQNKSIAQLKLRLDMLESQPNGLWQRFRRLAGI